MTCTCPECSKSFRQEISVPDHGARIKAIETLLREGLGRVGEAEVLEPKTPTSAVEWQSLSDAELNAIFALVYANEIRAVADQGEDALLNAARAVGAGHAPDRCSCTGTGRLSLRHDLTSI